MGANAMMKRYELRLFISIKYITANVIDTNHRRILAQASTVEHALKRAFDIGRTTNAKAGAIVGDVLARRLKVEGLHHDEVARGIYANLRKEIHKKGVGDTAANSNIVWALVNALRSNGVRVILDNHNQDSIL